MNRANDAGTDDDLFSDGGLFRLTVEASPAGMIITDEAGTIVLANRAASAIFGYPPGELIGRSVEALIPPRQRETHVADRADYHRHRRPRPMALGRNLFGVRKDGTPVPVDISLHPIDGLSGPLVLANVLDATERRRAERERETWDRVERLALLGQLAGGMAHELRTPLCVIRNDIFFLRQFADRIGEDGAECLEEIEQAVGKANRIVTELLDSTREALPQVAEGSVAAIVDAAIVDAALPEAVRVEVSVRPADLRLVADGEQIQRVLANLLRNASEASEGEGTIETTVLRLRGRVVFEVADRGRGIADDEIDRIFEPLFTTRRGGIGLGLSVSRRYAQRHGGTLTTTPRAGGGACFRLEIPQPIPGTTFTAGSGSAAAPASEPKHDRA